MGLTLVLSLPRHTTTHMLWHIAPSLSCPSDGDRAAAAATEPPPRRQGKVVYGECPRHSLLLLFSPPGGKVRLLLFLCVAPGLRPKREKGEKDAATDGWRRVSGRGKQHGRKGEKAWPREKGPDVSIRGGRRGTSHCSGPHPSPLPDSKPLFPFRQMAAMEEEERGRGEVSTPLFPHLFFRLVLSLFLRGREVRARKSLPPSSYRERSA